MSTKKEDIKTTLFKIHHFVEFDVIHKSNWYSSPLVFVLYLSQFIQMYNLISGWNGY